MILDAHGREIRRAVGFLGGLCVVPAKEPREDVVACQSVELDRVHTPLANDSPPAEGEL